MIKRWLVPLLVAGLLGACVQPQPHPAGFAPSPSPSASPSPRPLTFEDKVKAVIEAQAKALLRGDEEAFLSPAKDSRVRQSLAMRFRNLTALRISRAELTNTSLSRMEDGRWLGTMVVAFCFVTPDCVLDKVSEPVVWADTPSGPELTGLEAAKPTDNWYGDPQPWELTELAVAHGNRVLVAAPKSLAGRLPEVLKAAEAATATADAFVVGRLRPDLYRIYLADDTAWRTWYGESPAKWVAGYATGIGPTHTDVVVHTRSARGSFLPELMRHEMTHAAGLQGAYEWQGNWWLIEGLADLAAEPGAGVDRALRSYIRGRWDRTLPVSGPPDDASLQLAANYYGVAFLAVKRLDSRFGRDKLLRFFERVVSIGDSPEAASTQFFGTPWADVQADLISAIRSA